MKSTGLKTALLAAATLVTAFSAPSQTITSTPPSQTVKSRLPYGVEDVLKLSRAQVGEDVIVNYVETSGTVYNLSPDDIVYLKNEGVSERAINKMLEQRRVATEPRAEKSPATASVAPQPPESAAAPPKPQNAPEPSYAPTYQQPPVVVHPPSTVHVMPYPPVYAYPYYGSYFGCYRPYPGYYGGWYGPSLSFGFRFGGGHHHGRRYH